MPTTFDLSDVGSPSPQNPRPQNTSPGRGTGLPLDDFARPVLFIALAALVLVLGYLSWGMFSGAWGFAQFMTLTHDVRLRQINNIALCSTVLTVASIVAVVSLLIICLRDELIGYILTAISVFLYIGFPFITNQVYNLRGFKPSIATNDVVQDVQHLWWIYGVPGMMWVMGDFVRRFQTASENAAIQRATMKYGTDVSKQTNAKHTERFLGRCWELPFCRDNVRAKCPVYMKRRGPCWWYKQGCMCDERIVLQAVISSDWKQQTAGLAAPPPGPGAGPGAGISMSTGGGLSALGAQKPVHGPGSGAQQGIGLGVTVAQTKILTPQAKRERCRKCVIYNEHQRQKYKLMTGIALVLVPLFFYTQFSKIQAFATGIVSGLDTISKRFSFDQSASHAPLLSATQAGPVEWLLIGCLGVIVLSQVLRAIEFYCFKLKL